MARFAFPELRLGFIPGFGGIPRLKRDLGNAFVRDLLFTGRTLNATRAHGVCPLRGQADGRRACGVGGRAATKKNANGRCASVPYAGEMATQVRANECACV